MLFDQFFMGYLALAATCFGIGMKLVNPSPQFWAPAAFTVAALFAMLAIARYAELDPSLLIPPDRSLPWLLIVPLVVACIFAANHFGWLGKVRVFLSRWHLQWPIIRAPQQLPNPPPRVVAVDAAPTASESAPPGPATASPASTQEVAGPITWEFGSTSSPLGTSRSAGAPLWVDAFQIKGQNTSDGPIHARGALVRSDITGRTLPLLFSDEGQLVEANTVTIVPQGKFTLIGRIPPTDPSKSQGVVVDQFREQFGQFAFVFEYGDPRHYYGDQTTFTRRFSWAEVEKLLGQADVANRIHTRRDIVIREAPHYAQVPNYDKWDEQNVLRLFEAACLWNDEEPSLPMSDTSLRTFREFYKAIYEKRLGTKANLDDALKLGMAQTGWPREPNEDDPVNVNTKVSRQHFKSYAQGVGARPKFLFPDQRASWRPS